MSIAPEEPQAPARKSVFDTMREKTQAPRVQPDTLRDRATSFTRQNREAAAEVLTHEYSDKAFAKMAEQPGFKETFPEAQEFDDPKVRRRIWDQMRGSLHMEFGQDIPQSVSDSLWTAHQNRKEQLEMPPAAPVLRQLRGLGERALHRTATFGLWKAEQYARLHAHAQTPALEAFANRFGFLEEAGITKAGKMAEDIERTRETAKWLRGQLDRRRPELDGREGLITMADAGVTTGLLGIRKGWNALLRAMAERDGDEERFERYDANIKRLKERMGEIDLPDRRIDEVSSFRDFLEWSVASGGTQAPIVGQFIAGGMAGGKVGMLTGFAVSGGNPLGGTIGAIAGSMVGGFAIGQVAYMGDILDELHEEGVDVDEAWPIAMRRGAFASGASILVPGAMTASFSRFIMRRPLAEAAIRQRLRGVPAREIRRLNRQQIGEDMLRDLPIVAQWAGGSAIAESVGEMVAEYNVIRAYEEATGRIVPAQEKRSRIMNAGAVATGMGLGMGQMTGFSELGVRAERRAQELALDHHIELWESLENITPEEREATAKYFEEIGVKDVADDIRNFDPSQLDESERPAPRVFQIEKPSDAIMKWEEHMRDPDFAAAFLEQVETGRLATFTIEEQDGTKRSAEATELEDQKVDQVLEALEQNRDAYINVEAEGTTKEFDIVTFGNMLADITILRNEKARRETGGETVVEAEEVTETRPERPDEPADPTPETPPEEAVVEPTEPTEPPEGREPTEPAEPPEARPEPPTEPPTPPVEPEVTPETPPVEPVTPPETPAELTPEQRLEQFLQQPPDEARAVFPEDMSRAEQDLAEIAEVHADKADFDQTPFIYHSPLRPVDGISGIGDNFFDTQDGRRSIILRDESLPLNKLERLSLVPVSQAAREAAANEWMNREAEEAKEPVPPTPERVEEPESKRPLRPPSENPPVTEMRPPETIEEMPADLQEMHDKTIGFGKHKGDRLGDMWEQDPGWAEWAADELTGRDKEVGRYLRNHPEYHRRNPEAFAGAVIFASSPEAQQVLADHGLRAIVTPPDVNLEGNTHAYRDLFKRHGGKWDAERGAWRIRGDRADALLAELRELPDSSERSRDSETIGPRDPELRRVREAVGRRPDRSRLDRPVEEYVSGDTRALIERGKDFGIPPSVVEAQVEDVAKIIQAHRRHARGEDTPPMFVLASDPGSGKTFVMGGVIRELVQTGVVKPEEITYVTQNQQLIRQFMDDLSAFGVEGIDAITYAALRESDPKPTKLLVFDEAHNVKNVKGSRQAKRAAKWIEQADFSLFSSATPFENPVEAFYMEPAGAFEPWGDFDVFARAFGAQVVRTSPHDVTYRWVRSENSDIEAAEARRYFEREGVLSSRPLILPEGLVEAVFAAAEADPRGVELASQFEEAVEMVTDQRRLGGYALAWIMNFRKRLLEAAKVQTAIQQAQSAMDRGRNPILFVETKAERTIDIPDLVERENQYQQERSAALMMGDTPPTRKDFGLPPDGVVDVLAEYSEISGQDAIYIPPATEVITQALGRENVAIYTGEVSDAAAAKNLEDWRAGRKKVIVATMAKGGTGLSLHDKVGDHPTTQIVLNLPWSATQQKQVAQRNARYGLKSEAEIIWLFTNEIPLDRTLAARVGARMASMGATVTGEVPAASRALLEGEFDEAAIGEIQKKAKREGPLAPLPPPEPAPPREPGKDVVNQRRETEPVLEEGTAPEVGAEVDMVPGKEKKLAVLGGQPLDAQYALVRYEDLKPSHDPYTFRTTEGHTIGNTRNYDRVESYQDNVAKHALHLDPMEVLDLTAAHDHGPPIVVQDGQAIAGNSRLMSIIRAYRSHHDTSYQRYLDELRQHAEDFGLRADQIEDGMVLVRMVRGVSGQEAARLVPQLNISVTNRAPQNELAFTIARLLTREDLEALAPRDESETPQSVLKHRGPQMFDRLVEQGILGAADFNDYVNVTGNIRTLTERGINTFMDAIIGYVLEGDMQLYHDALSGAQRNLSDRAAFPVASVEALIARNALPESHSLRPHLQQAIRQLNAVGEEAHQESLFEQTISQEGQIILDAMRMFHRYPAKFGRAFKAMVDGVVDAADLSPEVDSLFETEMPSLFDLLYRGAKQEMKARFAEVYGDIGVPADMGQLEDMSTEDLRHLAAQYKNPKIPGIAKMSRDQLLETLDKRNQSIRATVPENVWKEANSTGESFFGQGQAAGLMDAENKARALREYNERKAAAKRGTAAEKGTAQERIAPDRTIIRDDTPVKSPEDIRLDFAPLIGKRVRVHSRLRHYLGIYYPSSSATFIKFRNDMNTMVHEVGHFLDDYFGITSEWVELPDSPFDTELVPHFSQHGSNPPKGVKGDQAKIYKRAEGVAEFIRAYMLNPAEAKARAPKFFEHFEQSIPQDVLEHLQEVGRQIVNIAFGEPYARILAHYDSQMEGLAAKYIPGEFRITARDRITSGLFDQYWPAMKAHETALRLKGIEDVKPIDNLEMMMNLASGARTQAMDVIKHGPFDERFNRVTTTDDGSQPIDGIGRLLEPAANTPAVEGQNPRLRDFRENLEKIAVYGIAETTITRAEVKEARIVDEYRQQILMRLERKLEQLGLVEDPAMEQAVQRARDDAASLGNIQKLFDTYIGDTEATILDPVADNDLYQIMNDKWVTEMQRLTGVGAGFHLDIEVAEQVMAQREQEPPHIQKMLDDALARYRGFAKQLVRMLRDSGRISAEAYNEITSENAHYVALNRVFEEQAPEWLELHLIRGAGPKNYSFTYEGSRRKIRNIYSALMAQTQWVVHEAAKTRGIRPLLEAISHQRGMHEGSLIALDEIGIMFRENPGKEVDGRPVTEHWLDGEQAWVAWEKNVGNAVKIFMDGGNWHSPVVEFMLKPFEWLARLLHANVTLQPAFYVRSTLRDMQHRPVVSRTGTGALSDPAQVYGMWLTEKGRLNYKRWYNEFMKFGGGLFGHQMVSERQYYRTLNAAMRELVDENKIVTTMQKIMEAAVNMPRWMEESGRIVEFRNAYRKARALKNKTEYESLNQKNLVALAKELDIPIPRGKRTQAELADHLYRTLGTGLGHDKLNAGLYAAYQARDITDYARGGWLIKWMNKYYPFLNASTQGLYRNWRGLRENPVGFTQRWLALNMQMRFMPWMWNVAFDAEDEWAALPDWQRDNFLNFYIGNGQFISIPTAWEQGSVGGAFDRAIIQWRGLDPEPWQGFTGSLYRNLPLSEVNMLGIFTPMLDVMKNHSSFHRNHIVPPWEAQLDLEYRQGTDNSSRLAHLMQGAIGIDARYIDHLIHGHLGVTGRQATAVSDIGRRDRPSRLPRQITGVHSHLPILHTNAGSRLLDRAAAMGMLNEPEIRAWREQYQQWLHAPTDEERHVIARRIREQAVELLEGFDTRSKTYHEDRKRRELVRAVTAFLHDPNEPDPEHQLRGEKASAIGRLRQYDMDFHEAIAVWRREMLSADPPMPLREVNRRQDQMLLNYMLYDRE